MNISKEVGERWYFELCETIVKLIKELGLKHLKKSNYFNASFGVCCFFVVVVVFFNWKEYFFHECMKSNGILNEQGGS